MVACAVVLWMLVLTIDQPDGRTLAVLLVALATTTIIGPGLAGADHDLDRASAIAWPVRRAAHLLIAGTVALGVLTMSVIAAEQLGGTGELARNVAGLTGLVGLGTAAAGASRAALLPVVWTALVLRFAAPMGEPPTGPVTSVVLTWMVQPLDARPATIAAVTLAATGTLAYAFIGSRRLG